MQADWLEAAKQLDPLAVAQQLGLETLHRRKPQFQCPACGESRRGKADRRLAAEVYRPGAWTCRRCGAGGSIVDLVSFRLNSARWSGERNVRDWLGDRHDLPAVERQPEIPQIVYPPTREVLDLWNGAADSERDAEVSNWLADRLGADWRRIAPLVRALPPRTSHPRWARYDGDRWADIGHRALFPTWDRDGCLRSLRARRVRDGSSPKTLPPAVFSTSGLVLACPLAVEMLRGRRQPTRLVVAEGEPRFLTWAARRREAVIGITSGAWTVALSTRLPTGAAVLVDTDHDDHGDRYAAHVIETLTGRCAVVRR